MTGPRPEIPEREVRELERSEWRTLQSVRLDALWDSPDAYTSSYEREADLDEDQWRERFDGARWVVATEDGHVIGFAGLVGPAAPHGVSHIESAWVAPAHRQEGVLRSLVDQLAEIGRAAPLDTLFLWVVGDNHVAQRAYAQLGFEPTGEVQPLGHPSGRVECRLRLDVTS